VGSCWKNTFINEFCCEQCVRPMDMACAGLARTKLELASSALGSDVVGAAGVRRFWRGSSRAQRLCRSVAGVLAAELPNAHVVSTVSGKPNASSLYFGDSFAHCICYLSHVE